MRDSLALLGAAVAGIACCATFPLVLGTAGAATLGAWTVAGLAGVVLVVSVAAVGLRRRRTGCDADGARSCRVDEFRKRPHQLRERLRG